MSKVIMICGKVCSGKTTYARQLQKKRGGVLLSVDEIMNTFFDSCVGERRMEFEERAKKYLYEKSLEILEEGSDVYLDWGFWTVEERAYAKDFYREKGIPVQLHCILIDDEEWRRRREKRNALIEAGKIRAFYVDEERAARFGAMFEAPKEADVWVSDEAD